MLCVVFLPNFRVVWGPFGIRSGSVRTKISEAKNFKISKIFNLFGRRRRGGSPLAAVPSPAAWRAPAAAATAAQVENFCRKQYFPGPTLLWYLTFLPDRLHRHFPHESVLRPRTMANSPHMHSAMSPRIDIKSMNPRLD